MAKVLIEVDDKFIDWDAWARGQLNGAGMKNEVVTDADTVSTSNERADDPWAGTNATATTGTVQRTEQRDTAASADTSHQNQMTGTQTISTPSGNQTVTFSPAGGPLCNCDEPAALYQGKSQKNNRKWKQYRCAKSAASGDGWKDKCEFSEWA